MTACITYVWFPSKLPHALLSTKWPSLAENSRAWFEVNVQFSARTGCGSQATIHWTIVVSALTQATQPRSASLLLFINFFAVSRGAGLRDDTMPTRRQKNANAKRFNWRFLRQQIRVARQQRGGDLGEKRMLKSEAKVSACIWSVTRAQTDRDRCEAKPFPNMCKTIRFANLGAQKRR